MGFKLVRVDATEPCKVPLPVGSHLIGRGKFLDCNDHRVSRKHAELTVTADSILLKSLHQNPCFFKKKSSKETIIFCQPNSHVLINGDQFGLLPDSYWYEIIYCVEESLPNITENVQTEEKVSNENDNAERDDHITEETDGDTEPYDNNDQEQMNYFSDAVKSEREEVPSLIPPDEPSTTIKTSDGCGIPMANHPEDMATTSRGQSIDQPKESTNKPNETTNQSDESAHEPNESTEQAENESKRTHSGEGSSCDIKKVKREPDMSPRKTADEGTNQNQPEDGVVAANQPIKAGHDSPPDVRPGPSNQALDQAGPSNDMDSPATPPAPVKLNNPLRERCMYGANCYRRNDQHKSTFSHPTDADWGTGEQGQCPWGASCCKSDPRHWRDHTHPPGVYAPPQRPGPLGGRPPGMQHVRRHGYNYYINANAVHFYDDHFEVEDSDGDSVDYDYEF